MKDPTYCPDRGDIVWLTFNPQAGHEQAGRRPALILTPASYNRVTGLVLACPITNRPKSYPFEVPLVGTRISGVVLSDHVKSLDWHARQAELAEATVPRSVIADVLAKVETLLR